MPARTPPKEPADGPSWLRLPDEALLDLRLCDLGLDIEGTALEQRIARLQDELDRAGLRFRPYVWLSTDWFTPDGHTGFAVPWLSWAVHHDWHHYKYTEAFGTYGVLDRLLGTDPEFRQLEDGEVVK